MMYHKYFGLEEPAFSIAVNPRYLYMSQQHKEALAHLLYGVQGGGFVMLSGEVGTGKTTIIRSLLEQLPENTEIAIVLNPMAEAIEILETVCDELGIEYNRERTTLKVLTDALQERLLENHRAGRNTVLLIDEAQLLSAEVLEQIRLLTNLETTTEKLLQIVLVGQPELNTLLAQPRLRQLSQRITARFHLKPLSVEETWAYVNHRLSVAGMPDDRNPFTPRIIKRIHAFTGGIPRRINILCERILIGAYGHNQSKVDNKILQLAKSEVTGHSPEEEKQASGTFWKLVAFSSIAVLVLVLTVATRFIREEIYQSDINKRESLATTPTSASVATGDANQEAASQDSTNQEIRQSASTVEPALQAASSPPTQPFFDDSMTAQRALFSYLGMAIDEEKYPCWELAGKNIDCRKVEIDNWNELKELNRPAVLTLTNRNKLLSYTVITGLGKSEASLLDTKHNSFTTELTHLGPLWSGEVFYVWQRPPGFKGPLTRGQRSETITWLAEQFAIMDGQDSPLTRAYFNDKLEQRVKIFQRENKLSDDGIVGQQTLMKLNDLMGIDKPLIIEE